jgi:hypothetical protein
MQTIAGIPVSVRGSDGTLPATYASIIRHCVAQARQLPPNAHVIVWLDRRYHVSGTFTEPNRIQLYCGGRTVYYLQFGLAHEFGHAEDSALGTMRGRTHSAAEAYANRRARAGSS